jgi:hypothetical protein
MIDSPDQPTGSDGEPTSGSPEPPRQELGEDSGKEPTGASPEPPTQQLGKSRSGRSNEFWLALAGIAATVVVGLTSNWLAYQSSGRQLKAESDRTAQGFSRDQRKVAYADYVNALADLSSAEYKVRYPFPGDPSVPVDPKQLESLLTDYTAAADKFSRAGSTVRLLASPGVEGAREAITGKHTVIFRQIDSLMAAARGGAPPDILVGLRFGVPVDTSRDLEQHFIDAAKKDLGLAD